jgi:hypothetical protein
VTAHSLGALGRHALCTHFLHCVQLKPGREGMWQHWMKCSRREADDSGHGDTHEVSMIVLPHARQVRFMCWYVDLKRCLGAPCRLGVRPHQCEVRHCHAHYQTQRPNTAFEKRRSSFCIDVIQNTIYIPPPGREGRHGSTRTPVQRLRTRKETSSS